MKISLFTGGFSKYNLEKVFKIASKYGYDAIEIAGTRPQAYTTDILEGKYKEILDLSNKYNLPIISYAPENNGSPHSLVFENEDYNRESIEFFKKSILAAKKIKSKYCMFAVNHPGYSRNKKEVQELFIKNMKELVSYAESINQDIILEPVTKYEGTIVCDSDDLAWAMSKIKSKNYHAMLDLACPITNREPVSEYFEKLGKENIVHIHFIDANSESEDHFIPGDGSIDFPNTIKYLKEIGYEGYLSLELFSMYDNEPEFSAINGINRIKKLINNN